jgi:hypothetical protein
MANIFIDSFNAHASQHFLSTPKTIEEQRALAAQGLATGKLRGKVIAQGPKAILYTQAENAEYNRRMEQHKANRRKVKVTLAATPWD